MLPDKVDACHAGLKDALKRDRKWFKINSVILEIIWVSLTLLALILGFLTSILVALGWPEGGDHKEKAALVVLPALGSLCGTILVQFRLRETWELRELGRIEVEEAINHTRYLKTDDPAQLEEKLREISLARVALARRQATRFFSVHSDKEQRGCGEGENSS